MPLLGVAMTGLFLLLVYALVRLWPANPSPDSAAACRPIWMLGRTFSLAYEVRILLLVVVVGSLGSFVHQATSFADCVGNNRRGASWLWWYVLRVPIGGTLAVVLYLTLRGGLMGNGDSFNVFWVAAIAALCGMFARQAADKLGEVFETLFQSAANQERKNKLTAAEVPVITGLEPGRVAAGETPLLAITGTGLGQVTAVRVGAANRKPREATATRATVALERSDTEHPGELEVAVLSRGRRGVYSGALEGGRGRGCGHEHGRQIMTRYRVTTSSLNVQTQPALTRKVIARVTPVDADRVRGGGRGRAPRVAGGRGGRP